MPTDTQRLVIKRHAPGRSVAFWIGAGFGALLCLWGAFEAGRMSAGYSIVAAARDHHSQSSELGELRDRLRQGESRLAAAEVARRVDKEAYTQVEKSLAELQARVGEQSQELTFYRGIVNPTDGISGMRIQRLQVLPGVAPRRYRIRIVLIQAARQDGVTTASADLVLDGLRGGRAASLPLSEIGTASRPLSFSFRYFQEAETEIELPADFVPQRVQVEVRTAKGGPSIRQSYPWKIETT